MAKEKRADRKGLEDAAAAISPDSLDKAKSAIAIDCKEYIRWANIMAESLDKKVNTAEEVKRFARAVALCLLGHLPVKPWTCPFCIQYSGDQSCKGCGYALTHGGRCDKDSSAFSQFIEAFHELGQAIYQDNEEVSFDLSYAKNILKRSFCQSSMAAKKMIEGMPKASAFELMEMKARYLHEMALLIPIILLSSNSQEKLQEVKNKLDSYW